MPQTNRKPKGANTPGRSAILPPLQGIATNPLLGLRNTEMQTVQVGKTLRELCPETKDFVVCRIAGTEGYISRNDWDYQVQPNDIIIWEMYPGGDTVRSILQIVMVVAAIMFPPYAALILVAGTIALNLLLPPSQPASGDSKTPSPTYTTSLSQNQARLNDPIPRICGRHKVTPSFASQPYFTFEGADGDQYYYALLAIGIGQHEIEQELIDDTVLSHFSDVKTHTYLPAGTLPSAVEANVVTAPEVSNADLKTGVYVGGFAACGPRKIARSIGIDITAPRGLGHSEDDGNMSNLSVTFQVEWKEIDDFGVAKTDWTVLATETKTAASNRQQRWSLKYALPRDMRCEIRVKRIDARSESSRDLHDLSWFGMRAYLAMPAPLNPHCAHFEIVLRASEQLSQLSQRAIAFIVRSKARTWHPTTGWGPYEHTRNPAWWLLDLAKDPIWGLNLTDDRIDLQSFYELALLWIERQDRFDFVFDSTMDGWEAMQLIARSGRARVFRRNGILTIARDGLDNLPVTAYTPRNTQPKSMTMTETLPGFNDPDGVIIEYFDNRSWTWTPVECPCPGVDYGASPTITRNPIRMRLSGITGAIHAQREGVYEAARMLYRRRTVHCVTEMQGMLPAYMSMVRWMPEIPGYGITGDVLAFDGVDGILALSEPVEFGDDNDEDRYITLIRDDGSLSGPYLCSYVIDYPDRVRFGTIFDPPGAPDFQLICDDPTRERPKFLFGKMDISDDRVKILSISDGGESDEGAPMIRIDAVVDDPRIHAADNYLLPLAGSPTVIQDPVDHGEVASDGDSGISGGVSPALTSFWLDGKSVNAVRAGPCVMALQFKNDGTLGFYETPGGTNGWLPHDASSNFMLGSVFPLASHNEVVGGKVKEWLSGPTPQPTTVTDDYEIRFTLTSSFEEVSPYGGLDRDVMLKILTNSAFDQEKPFGTWISLGETQDLYFAIPEQSNYIEFIQEERRVVVDIRHIASGLIQANCVIDITCRVEGLPDNSGGGGA